MRFILLLGLCMVAACGGTVSTIDGGNTDASSDATKSDGGNTDSGSSACDGGCSAGLVCCNNACVNTNNDPHNCGSCGNPCNTASQMCQGGTCGASQCNPACTSGYICCEIDGPGPSGPPQCEQGDTCPVGCPLCN